MVRQDQDMGSRYNEGFNHVDNSHRMFLSFYKNDELFLPENRELIENSLKKPCALITSCEQFV